MFNAFSVYIPVVKESRDGPQFLAGVGVSHFGLQLSAVTTKQQICNYGLCPKIRNYNGMNIRIKT